MKNKTKIALVVIAILALCLTSFGAWVDSDPRPSLPTQIFEFTIGTGIVFTFLFGLYVGVAYLMADNKQDFF